jgi:hypothetical protein
MQTPAFRAALCSEEIRHQRLSLIFLCVVWCFALCDGASPAWFFDTVEVWVRVPTGTVVNANPDWLPVLSSRLGLWAGELLLNL